METIEPQTAAEAFELYDEHVLACPHCVAGDCLAADKLYWSYRARLIIEGS